MKKTVWLLFLLITSFASAVSYDENRFFNSCSYGMDITDNPCYLKKILLSLGNSSNTHASLYNYDYYFTGPVAYPYHICCKGDELVETGPTYSDIWGNAILLRLTEETNSHVSTLYSEPYGVNATFQAPGGIYCKLQETIPTATGSNWYLKIVSFSIGEDNTHLGSPDTYSLKLWCRGGIPMRSGEKILAPDEVSNIYIMNSTGQLIFGKAIDDSAGYEPEEFFARKECENSDECVALNNGFPECFSKGTEYEVDDFTISGQPEICSVNNYWCPKFFTYDIQDARCEFDYVSCYDQTQSDIDKCWVREKNYTTIPDQELFWLYALDTCSYKGDEFENRQSCCLTTIIHENPYQQWKDVCVLEAGGSNTDCAP